MPSDVQICSSAAVLLGDNSFSSFDESNTSRRANILWAQTRDMVLRSHPWNCAIKRIALAPNAAAPVYGWTYAFLLPADCLRVLDADDAEHKVEGRNILADTNPLYVRYVYRNDDVASYDVLLIAALTAAMAAELAYPITKSTSAHDFFMRLYVEKLRVARSVDGQEDSPDTFGDNPFISVRNGG